jgi:hypothetical protein
MIGLLAVPSSLCSRKLAGSGNLTFRHVAWRAKQERGAVIIDDVEKADMEEIEEERDARERSVTIDSGLEFKEAVLNNEDRLER